jgi:hypothetical protein
VLVKSAKQIICMESDEAKQYFMTEWQKPEGAVESWMGRIEEEM